MKKIIAITLAVVLVLALGAGAVLASSSQPASKATAKVADITLIDSTDGQGWLTILEQDIKTPNGKDLFIDVSLEAGLYTQTKVKSKGGTSDSSMAKAVLEVRVLVDGAEAYPGEVVFASRMQTLTAKFAGYLDDFDVLTDEELELILDTMNANAFNFIADDLTSGVHTIEVQARIDTDTAVDTGSASALATVGNGSVTIELVRMIQGEDIELTEQP